MHGVQCGSPGIGAATAQGCRTRTWKGEVCVCSACVRV